MTHNSRDGVTGSFQISIIIFSLFFPWFICIFNHALESIFAWEEEEVLASNLVAPCFAIRIYPFFCILNQYNDNSCVKCNYSTRHKIEFISKTIQSMSFWLEFRVIYISWGSLSKIWWNFFFVGANKRAMVHRNLNRYHSHSLAVMINVLLVRPMRHFKYISMLNGIVIKRKTGNMKRRQVFAANRIWKKEKKDTQIPLCFAVWILFDIVCAPSRRQSIISASIDMSVMRLKNINVWTSTDTWK